MARIELPAFIKSMSGTISKKKLSDGTIIRCVVTKNNRMRIQTQSPRTTAPTAKEIAKRTRFGTISKAVTIVRKELELESDPETQRRVWEAMGTIYDRLLERGKPITPEILAELYAYLEW